MSLIINIMPHQHYLMLMKLLFILFIETGLIFVTQLSSPALPLPFAVLLVQRINGPKKVDHHG